MAAIAFTRKRALSVTATPPPTGKRSRPTPPSADGSHSDGPKKIHYLSRAKSLVPQFPLNIGRASPFFRLRTPYWAVSELSNAVLRDNFLRWLFAVCEKDDKYVDLLVLEALERLATEDKMVLPTGVLHTNVVREDAAAKNVLWVFMFGTVACAGDHCDQMLTSLHMHNRRVSTLEWYAPACGHDLRFCTKCASASWCWMCDAGREMTHRFVQQSVGTTVNQHTMCHAQPCSLCAFFVML